MPIILPKGFSKEDRTPRSQIKIQPSTVPWEFVWICSRCKNPNTQRKADFSDNHAFSCHGCGFTWAASVIPDDIMTYLKDTKGMGNIRVLPSQR